MERLGRAPNSRAAYIAIAKDPGQGVLSIGIEMIHSLFMHVFHGEGEPGAAPRDYVHAEIPLGTLSLTVPIE
jgi:hypothetical protein